MQTMITDRELKAFKPKDKPYLKSLGGGLSARIYPSGKKVFLYRYTLKGQTQKWFTLGEYPQLTLAEARKQKNDFAQQVKEGIDLNLDKKTKVIERIGEPTVKEAFAKFYSDHLVKQRKTPEETARYFDRDILPVIGPMKIKNVKKAHIHEVLDQFLERGSNIAANRCLSALKVFFGYCLERGVIESDPTALIRKKNVGGIERPKERVLTLSELKTFWEKIDTAPFSRQAQLVLKLLTLTGQRIGEVCLAEWSEFDFAEKVWTIPASRTKTNSINRIPLGGLMIEYLGELKALSNDSPFVVQSPQTTDTHKPVTPRGIDRAVNRHQDHFGLEKWTPHDLRRTFTTQMNEMGIAPYVIEKILNHKMQGMMAVYNKAEYWEDKVKAIQAWENKIKEILAGDKVISMNRKSS